MSPLRSAQFRKVAVLFTRFGLAATYLSGVADRFGAWGRAGAPNVSWGDFQHFVSRVLALLPHVSSPIALVVAWIATVLDAAIGLGLLIGVRTKTMAIGSAILLVGYGLVLATSPGGLHETFSYGTFGLAGASMLLAAVVDDT